MFRLSYPSDRKNASPREEDTVRIGGRTYRLRPWHHAAAGFLTLAVWAAVALILMAVYGGVR